ncbi:hypothetical protein HMPREF1137_0525 [Actinomyces sp. ICM39]|uniref:hypothetical protein n=1 Tax=Actinomyces sp. ICM39 TaxID=1105029 RepID=UPI0002770D28|nr:hypothetical protein [Actinomyces sp. ICM39]EJN46371.1 hypothetical protein HMPREF1137_0525 [Actinomyces sp. ICM39]
MTNPNPSVPDPNAYPASSPQQSSYLYQGGVPPQGTMQPGNGAAAQGYAQAGNAGYGYAPMAPVKRRVSYKLAGILSGIGALLAVSPFLAWFVIELIPGNHGDGGDGLYWLAVGMIFYILPIGLILIVAGIVAAIVSAVMNSSSRS